MKCVRRESNSEPVCRLLPHFLRHDGLSCTDKFERFEERNSLEQKLKNAEIDRSERDKRIQQVLAKGDQLNKKLEDQNKAQAVEHR